MRKTLFLLVLILILSSMNVYCDDVYREEYNSEQWSEMQKTGSEKTVYSQWKNDIFYIKITGFEKNTYSDLIDLLNKNTPAKVIIDLRNNQGGYIDEAVKLAAVFVEKNKKIVSLLYNDGTKKAYTGTGEFSDMDTVILINTLTASAAEAFALSLTQNGIASVGEVTFGKSLIQRYSSTKNGGEKNTVGHFAFDGINIQNKGIDPLYVVHNKTELKYDKEKKKYVVIENDEQLKCAIKLFREE